ncbi:MAG: response regulator [Spirochaetales bacterium]|nr:response regulator [Spirochaetales bacterium]
MNMRILSISACLLCAVFVFSQDSSKLESLRFLDFNPQFTNTWLYEDSDNHDYRSSAFDDSLWASGFPGTQLTSERGQESSPPVYWIRTRFEVSRNLKGVDILLHMEIPGPFECYLNGRMIYERGLVDRQYQTIGSEYPLVTLRDRDLKYTGLNVFAVRILRQKDEPLLLPNVNAFRINGLMYHPSSPSFMQSENYAMISFLFSVIFFTLFVFRRNDDSSLFFAIANLCFAYYFHRMVVPPLILPYILSFSFSKACLLFAVFFLVVFLRSYFGRALRTSSIIILAVLAGALGTVMTLVPRSIAEAESLFNTVVLIPSFLGIIYIGVLAYHGISENQRTASIVFVGAVLAVAMGMHDMLYSFLQLTPRFWLQGFSIIAFDFAIFISLIFHIVNIFKDLENYTHKVEEAVRERTIELDMVNKNLEKALLDAREANRAKSDFLANVSHEIRTPLNCIVGFAEIIAHQNQNASIGEYSDMIVQESGKLQHLIDEILDISKIESGKVEAVCEEFDIRELVDSVHRGFSGIAAQKHLSFSVSIDENIPDTLTGDGFRLGQVLMNLISNAMKFTHQGSVSLTVNIASSSPFTVRFAVADTGIGIKKSIRKSIFDSFVQADSSTVRRYGGTGLGTTISKRLVELMGGTIGFTSEEGKGTTFFFTIPLGQAPETMTGSPLPGTTDIVNLKGHVLLVEDYPPNRTIVESMLKDAGLTWDTAANGLEAVDLFAQNSYSVILMDIQMPEMDGCEATRAIRRMEKKAKKKPVPVIGFTANAFPAEIEKYIKLGMNDVITKPVRRRDFFHTLQQVLSGGTGFSAAPSLRKSRVFDYQGLLQELGWDSATSRKLVREFLAILDTQIPDIRTGLSEQKFSEAHRAFHSIRGGAAGIWAEELSEKAGFLESFLKQNLESTDTACISVTDLEKLFHDFLSAYQRFRESAHIAMED